MVTSSETIYQQIGGEPGLREFVDSLYDTMEDLPEVALVREMHTGDLSYARERLFMFLSGMLGGPPLYMEAFGHPRLRRQHLQFEIGNTERDQWLLCAKNAADKLCVPGHAKQSLMVVLTEMANHLRNQSDVGNTALMAKEDKACFLNLASTDQATDHD